MSRAIPLDVQSRKGPLALSLGIASTIVYLISRHIIYPLYVNPLSKIPGPRVNYFLPFTGILYDLLRTDVVTVIKRFAAQYGGIFRYNTEWNMSNILVSDPKLIKEVLATNTYNYEKTQKFHNSFDRVLGNGLLLAEGNIHRQQRKALNPAFRIQALRLSIPMVFVPAIRMTNRWKDSFENNQTLVDFNISEWLGFLSLDVVCLASFGQDIEDIETEEAIALNQAYRTVLTTKPSITNLLWLFFPILRYIPTTRSCKIVNAYRMINKGTAAILDSGINQFNLSKTGCTKNLLFRIIEATEKAETCIKRSDLFGHLLTFLTVGHETTSVGTTWCLWLLAQHQDIQTALREEIQPLFDKINTAHPLFMGDHYHQDDMTEAHLPSYEEINKLNLLNNVVKETLRLIPPVPVTDRQNTKDSVLGNYFIPKGSRIVLAPIVNHHSPAIWGEDVMEFRPSRWNEEPAASVGPYEYMPFLAGSRRCIGQRFALLEIKIMLITLISNFQFFDNAGINYSKNQFLTARPEPDMILSVKRL